MSQIRREVLNAFKRLHRTRQKVFQNDEVALVAGRKEINEHFRKNRDTTDENEIKKMINLALDVDKELRTNIIQAIRKDEGVYELRLTEETTRLNNVPFDPNAPIGKTRQRRNGCCGDCGCDESTQAVSNISSEKLSKT